MRLFIFFPLPSMSDSIRSATSWAFKSGSSGIVLCCRNIGSESSTSYPNISPNMPKRKNGKDEPAGTSFAAFDFDDRLLKVRLLSEINRTAQHKCMQYLGDSRGRMAYTYAGAALNDSTGYGREECDGEGTDRKWENRSLPLTRHPEGHRLSSSKTLSQ